MIDRAAVGLDNEPDHTHPFEIPGMANLMQLARALGGGSYPGLGSGQNDTMPLVDSVAPGFPLNLPFLVPANTVKQQAVALTFQPQAFRTYISATPHAHGGDTVETLSITIDINSADHLHGIEQVGHKHAMPIKDQGGGAVGAAVLANVAASRLEGNLAIGGGTFGPFSGTDVAASSDHDHGANTTTTNHLHTNPTHTHTPGTTGTNNPASGVQEGTSPDAMHVMVDGTDVTTQLGGPFTNAQTELDITPYVGPGTGLHTVQVTTATNLGRIAGFVRNKAIVNNLALL